MGRQPVGADVTTGAFVGTVLTWLQATFAAITHTHAGTDITSGTVAAARLPDATSGAKGVVQLAGDIGGTAAAPTVAKIATATISGSPGTPSSSNFLRGDGTWAAAGGAFPASYSGGPSGGQVVPPFSTGAGTGSQIGSQPAGARLVWFPVNLGACTITGFQVNVTTAGDGSSVIKVGLYSDWGGVRPNALVQTLGTVASTTTGLKALTGLSYAWPGGTLWVAAVEQGHTSTCAQVTNDTIQFPVATIQSLSTSIQGICQDSVSGTLPANASGENAFTTIRPRIYLTIQ